jgi:23S rRNA maturation-related 3'-5' exoribonuclease YhaM
MINQMKERFNKLLRSTEIKGIDNLITHLELNGFYHSPASSGNHLCTEGGLLEHSLNVYDVAMEMHNETSLGYSLNFNDVVIACLLHDVGKMGAFGEPNYVPNILKSTGEQSTKKPWVTTNIGIQHQDISIMTVNKFIDLNREQAIAIKYHNGLYTPDGRDIKGNETPLYMIVHFADMWASRVIEKKGE